MMRYSKRRVLVTGADGFIGSHLVEKLAEEGASVRAFVNYNSFNSWGWIDSLQPEVKSKLEIFSGDIRDNHCVAKAVEGMETVFHLAALIAIPFSYVAPESYVDTNVKGTLNVLQAVQRHNISHLLVTSTSEVYGTARYVPINESHPYQGQSPYSASKIAADRMAEAFHRSFDVPVTIVRPFNTFGPRQSARAVIPTLISQLLSNSENIKLGSIHPTRDLLYVKDTVAGFLAIADEKSTIGEEINIATGIEISMGELAHTLLQMINPKARIVLDESRIRPNKSEVDQLLGCNEKIQRLTSWRPSYDLARGLQETVEWFRIPSNLERYKAHIYNV